MTAHPIDTEALRPRLARAIKSGIDAYPIEEWDPRDEWEVAADEVLLIVRDLLAAAEHRADKAEKVHRDLASALGFGDGITEPMADNETIIQRVGEAVSDSNDLWDLTQAECVWAGCDLDEDCHTHHPVLRAEAAEHRATRAEAQSEARRINAEYWKALAGEHWARIKAVRALATQEDEYDDWVVTRDAVLRALDGDA